MKSLLSICLFFRPYVRPFLCSLVCRNFSQGLFISFLLTFRATYEKNSYFIKIGKNKAKMNLRAVRTALYEKFLLVQNGSFVFFKNQFLFFLFNIFFVKR